MKNGVFKHVRFLCVLARVVNSIQFVLEEKVMGESGLHPFEVTGTEGGFSSVKQ